jgi:hypothetical protein
MIKEEYLAIAVSRYEELEALKEKDNFYDYEKSIWSLCVPIVSGLSCATAADITRLFVANNFAYLHI